MEGGPRTLGTEGKNLKVQTPALIHRYSGKKEVLGEEGAVFPWGSQSGDIPA